MSGEEEAEKIIIIISALRSLSVSVCLSVSAGKLIPIFAHTSGQQSDENVRGGSELNHSKAK